MSAGAKGPQDVTTICLGGGRVRHNQPAGLEIRMSSFFFISSLLPPPPAMKAGPSPEAPSVEV